MIVKNEQESIIYKKRKLPERGKRRRIINHDLNRSSSNNSSKINNDFNEFIKRKNNIKSLSEPQLNRIVMKENLSFSYSDVILNKSYVEAENLGGKIKHKSDKKDATMKETTLKSKDTLKVLKKKLKTSSQSSEDEKNVQTNLLNPHRIPINVRRTLLILYSKSKINKSKH